MEKWTKVCDAPCFLYHLKHSFLLALFLAVCWNMQEEWKELLAHYKVTLPLAKGAALLYNSFILRWGLVILVPWMMAEKWHHVKNATTKDKYINLAVCGFFLFVLLKGNWYYPWLIEGLISFKWYWTACLGLYASAVVILMFFQEKKKLWHNKDKENVRNTKGFAADCNVTKKELLSNYAEAIAERLLHTEIKEESFSIGISGQWGYGKTTMLNLITEHLEDRSLLFEFMPWNSNSPEKIIDDFFILLRNNVARNINPQLDKPITQYAQQLLSINGKDPWITFLRSMALNHAEQDTLSVKKKIANILSESNRKIVVTIDDIDRLDRDELFEVLRLIRNTASFPNLVYILTYDKQYVVNQLAMKDITHPELYLEKIINVEVALPKVMDYELRDCFLHDLHEMLEKDVIESIENAIDKDHRNLSMMTSLLTNFREMKRFARQLAVHISFARDRLENDIHVEDLFWLELIRYADYELYTTMSHYPETLFNMGNTATGHVITLQGDIKKQLAPDYKGERIADVKILNVLQYLFTPSFIKIPTSSIIYPNNYSRYFLLGLEKRKFYSQHLNNLLDIGNKEELHKALDEYLGASDETERYDLQSLLFLMRNLNYAEMEFGRFQKVMQLLSTLNAYSQENEVNSIFYYLTLKEDVVEKEDGKWIETIMETVMTSHDVKNVVFRSRLLKSISDNTRCNKTQKALYERTLQNMALNFTCWAEATKPDAIDIINTQSILHKLIKNACVTSYEDEHGNEMEHNVECLIKDAVFGFFRKNPSDQGSQFDRYFDVQATEEEILYGIDESEVMQRAQARMESIFDDYHLCDDFRKNCFQDKLAKIQPLTDIKPKKITKSKEKRKRKR